MNLSRKWRRLGAVAALIALGLSGLALPKPASAAPLYNPAAALAAQSPIENAALVWNGQAYCWYPDGWHGPGWYWCGYAWRHGLGWGGGAGWRGWAVPHRGWPHHGRHAGGRPRGHWGHHHGGGHHHHGGGRPHGHHGHGHHGGHHGGHGRHH